MSVHIRDARIGDEGAILGFVRELAAYEKLEHEVVASADQLRENLFGAAPKVFALIAESDGAPCGFALYFFNFSTFLGRHGVYLEDLYVTPQKRGGGFGKAMLARLAHIAKTNNCGRLEWSVLDWNTPAIEFYKSLDAEPMDGWTIFRLTNDALTSLAAQDGGAT